jgi:hypothetical protein
VKAGDRRWVTLSGVTGSPDGSGVDEIVQQLDREIWAFISVKQRYPILMKTAAEMERLRARQDIRPRSNSAAIQLMRDSFDMLVIDLYSVRESTIKERIARPVEAVSRSSFANSVDGS